MSAPRIPGLRPLPPAADPRAPSFNDPVRSAAEAVERWRQPEQDARRRGEHSGGRNDAHVERDRQHPRNARRAERDERAQTHSCEEQARGRAERGKQKTLREQLAHEALAARADHGAHGDLAAARGRAGQEHVRDVGAGDEEHEPHRAEEDQQRRAHGPDDALRQAGDAHVAVGPGELFFEARRDRRNLRTRLLDRCARCEARKDPERLRRPAVRLRVHGERCPHLGVRCPEGSEGEIGRHDTDHLVRLTVKDNRPLEDTGIAAEVAHPEAEADHLPVTPLAVIVRRPGAAEERCDAEHRENVGGHLDRRHFLRLIDSGEIGGPGLSRAHRVEGARVALPVEIVRRRNRVYAVVEDHHEALGCAVGSGRSSTPLTTLRIAELAPMPRASAATAARVNPGLRVSARAA